MAVSLTHSFTSAITDSADTTLVQPSHWNAQHQLTCATSVILGRVTASTGAVEELTPSQVKGLLAVAVVDVAGLQAALDAKQVAGSYQPLATVLTNTTASFTTAHETKLSGIATGATANSADATLLTRANHTGTQDVATITGLGTLATQNGTFSGTSSGTNTGDQTTITGNAGSATILATGRTIAITGDLSWNSGSFNGSANVTSAGTLATVNGNVGTFGSGSDVPVITVNAKGLVTAVSTAAVSGSGGGLSVGLAQYISAANYSM